MSRNTNSIQSIYTYLYIKKKKKKRGYNHYLKFVFWKLEYDGVANQVMDL